MIPPISMAASRDQALSALNDFLPKVPFYGQKRNLVIPGHEDVSRLSGALRHRLIQESEIVDAVLHHHSFQAGEKYLQEVLWRTYWKGWLEWHPSVWADYKHSLKAWHDGADDRAQERAVALMEGRSGVAIMDFFAQELTQTGYLHNHARMWWASFWIHVERLPWYVGADFFMRHLCDADVASNTLGWRWVAGLQTAGKSYLVRASNLRKYCEPSLLEAHQAGLERLEDGVVEAWPASYLTIPCVETLGRPTADLSRWVDRRVGWWVHPEDGLADQKPLQKANPVSVLCTSRVHETLGSSVSAPSPRYRHQVADDVRQRVLSFMGSGDRVPTVEPSEHWMESLVQWASKNHLEAVLAYRPFVGSIHDQVTDLEIQLKAAGVAIVWVEREWDTTWFPYAKKGFFPFWKSAGQQLQARQISLTS